MEYTPRRKLTREFKLEAVRQAALSEKPQGPAGSGAGRTRRPAANVAARVREGGGERYRQA